VGSYVSGNQNSALFYGDVVERDNQAGALRQCLLGLPEHSNGGLFVFVHWVGEVVHDFVEAEFEDYEIRVASLQSLRPVGVIVLIEEPQPCALNPD